jgi:hypothetical protein
VPNHSALGVVGLDEGASSVGEVAGIDLARDERRKMKSPLGDPYRALPMCPPVLGRNLG